MLLMRKCKVVRLVRVRKHYWHKGVQKNICPLFCLSKLKGSLPILFLYIVIKIIVFYVFKNSKKYIRL